ncbi:hypothetical protein BD410DRAFT_901636 [Rickenella mellea]|uniref:ASX DEUBAD domain-containing protein n=1 Tax=Rickenella mellea TaxID=50990 RepID=A0A4Y7PNP7_9AGAM|nr:hypothetical protein BD410DRAFT_901636 [Rickenella mellea]
MSETEASTSTGRPKRSTKVPNKYVESHNILQQPSKANGTLRQTQKRKKYDEPVEIIAESPDTLDFILTDIKSPLTTMDISDVVSAAAWGMLSDEAKQKLCHHLPPTAFLDYQPVVDRSHPSQRVGRTPEEGANHDAMDVDPLQRIPGHVDSAMFTDPHFESAARTFQDHLYSGWLTEAHRELVNSHQDGIRSGILHAPWKDDVWIRDHPPIVPPSTTGIMAQPESSQQAGDAAGLRLTDLAQYGVVKTGDIISYKRTFKIDTLTLTIEKDVLIRAIHPKSFVITVLTSPGADSAIPSSLLPPFASAHDFNAAYDSACAESIVREMIITSPSQLENTLLDMDGTVERNRRPHSNAWKHTTLWRFAEGRDVGLQGDLQIAMLLEKGGRECYGTLFYLRGCFYHEN